MNFRDIYEYYADIVRIVSNADLDSETHKIDARPISRYEKLRGKIAGENIEFSDHATFEFFEQIEIRDGKVFQIEYSYQYVQSDGFYFRYDKDPENDRPPLHPECHLHVNLEDIRYKTHSTNFGEVFEFILARFYNGRASNGRKPRTPER
jgi:hypothetical protein